MKIGKVLATAAVSGILMGTLVGCGGADKAAADPNTPATDPAAGGAKSSCSGAGGAAPASTDGQKASCSAKGSCSGSSGAAPKTN